MGKNTKKSKSKGGWSDTPDAGFNSPFAALRPGSPPPEPEPEPEPRPGPEPIATPKRAHVRKERKGRGGKTVTLVSHLDLPPDVLEQWSRELRKELGCGGGVEGDELLFQGDQRERLAKALEARGIPRVTRA